MAGEPGVKPTLITGRAPPEREQEIPHKGQQVATVNLGRPRKQRLEKLVLAGRSSKISSCKDFELCPALGRGMRTPHLRGEGY